ncbi:fumarylacetoacetate hydrolase family protein [Lacisediminihabitans profunda]|uniref:fumarylacetoacetate hydrolase family protein n=1 Tax=Lacisediminihabitans profunda TaxID=2594790 RepID=UPI0016501D7E|nr:fumarylacetoacetate hydrolase family protein [Lacisediminihabitans profunda]
MDTGVPPPAGLAQAAIGADAPEQQPDRDEGVTLLVAQTTLGIARVLGTRYEVLDVGRATVSDLLTSGQFSQLEGAKVSATMERELVTLVAPMPRPGKIVIVGLNYNDHAVEIGAELPLVPRVHLTSSSAVIGPTEDIPLPRIADMAVDFEGEMAVIIGEPATDVTVAAAWSHVAGITAANDITARDVQDGSNLHVAGPNVGLAKGFDGFKPLGPAILSRDSVREGQALILRTLVDGEVRQESNTAEMHFTVPELVSRISQYTTLQRGDVILTGTPGGVGVSSGRFLRAGQLVEVQLEGVGSLRNRIVATSQPLS